MDARHLLQAGLLIAAGSACAGLPRPGRFDRDELEEVKATVSSLRKLSFEEEVTIEWLSSSELRERMQRAFEGEANREATERQSLAFAAIGVTPWGHDLKKSLVQIRSEQVVGIYDSEAKKIVILDELPPDTSERAITIALAHELVHALQDQHFSIGANYDNLPTTDEGIAYQAMVEGEANLIAFVLGGEGVSPDGKLKQGVFPWLERMAILNKRRVRSALDHLPPLLVEIMNAKYFDGMLLAASCVSRGGWDALADLHNVVPGSTEQVLHTRKYFTRSDLPSTIDLDELALAPLFGDGWEPIMDDVVGELVIRILFSHFSDEWVKDRKSDRVREQRFNREAGWDGDRLIVYRKGQEVAFVWVTVWDSGQQATAFATGYQEILRRLFEHGLGEGREATAQGHHAELRMQPNWRIVQRDAAVLTVAGLPLLTSQALNDLSERVEVRAPVLEGLVLGSLSASELSRLGVPATSGAEVVATGERGKWLGFGVADVILSIDGAPIGAGDPLLDLMQRLVDSEKDVELRVWRQGATATVRLRDRGGNADWHWEGCAGDRGKLSVSVEDGEDCRVAVGRAQLGVAPLFEQSAPTGRCPIEVRCAGDRVWRATRDLTEEHESIHIRRIELVADRNSWGLGLCSRFPDEVRK